MRNSAIFLLLIFFISQHIVAQSSKMAETPLNMYDGKRKALLIGNKNYQFYRPLSNTERDVDAMTKVLKNLGFEVSSYKNLDYQATVIALRKFKETLNPNDVALIYYSGHGIGSNTQSYLLPVDASIKCTDELEVFVPLSLNKIIKDLEQKQVRNSFIFLDACRNLPNLSACSNAKDAQDPQGLVMPKTNPRGNLIVFATGEGKTADDDTYDKTNSLFTAELIKKLQTPNVGIRTILDNVINAVEERSNGKQIPQKLEDLRGDFVFVLSNEIPKPVPTIKQPFNGEIKDLPFGPPMVFVKGGSFEMGSVKGDPDARDYEMVSGKKHRVSVSDFWMAQTEVTVEQYLAFCEATYGHYPEWLENGSNYHVETGTSKLYSDKGYSRTALQLPIAGVSWHDAVSYCVWLSKKTGLNYRLPTEAEWEFASRGGIESKNTVYAGSNNINEVGWNSSNSDDKPKNIKQKQPNELGLYDMTGNVWEWCQDWYGEYTANSEQNPKGASSGVFRVLRGGGWNNAPQISRVAFRSGGVSYDRFNNYGFRVIFSQ